jgi:Zn-finger nucleic acid-binding protein
MIILENRSVKFDVCYLGCGGIWFDWLEFKKIDEAHEADPEFIKKISNCATKKINFSEKVSCPKCPKQPMIRKFSSFKRQSEIDECPQCGGFWLDAGELISIHSEFKNETEKKAAAQKFIDGLLQECPETQKELDRLNKVQNILGFISFR